MTKNFFPTLGDALEGVREYLAQTGSAIAEPEPFFDFFAMGGVRYGETKSRADLLSHHKGKEITGRMADRGISLTVYRMESGTYEAVAYIS